MERVHRHRPDLEPVSTSCPTAKRTVRAANPAVPAFRRGPLGSGLGYQTLNARDQLAYDQVMAVIVVIGIIGYALDTLSRVVFDRR